METTISQYSRMNKVTFCFEYKGRAICVAFIQSLINTSHWNVLIIDEGKDSPVDAGKAIVLSPIRIDLTLAVLSFEDYIYTLELAPVAPGLRKI